MKSKIEKIESVYDLYDGDRNVDANKLKDILNNIIEALNSQSQPEEKKQRVGCEYSDCYRCPECNDELLVTCLHPLELLCTRCREYVEIEDVVEKATYVCAKGEFEVKDTPEEWEKKDWKYRFRKLFYNSGYDYDIPLIEQEVLKDFISKELDRARKEGYKEGFEDGLQDVKKIEREK